MLYVATPAATATGSAAILRFSGPSGLRGNVQPDATISGPLTQLAAPVIALDKSTDRLYALVSTGAATGAILVFDNASTKNGNIAPDRVISGATTTIEGTGVLSVDGTRNIIYAAATLDADGHVDILVFKNASVAAGNIAPSAVLKFATAGVGPTDMFLDETNDRLFISDSAQEIQVFDNASTLVSGPMMANRVISGPHVGVIGSITHIALDPTGRLLASTGGAGVGTLSPGSINIYANAATATGDVAPVAAITGNLTGLGVSGPGSLSVFTGPGSTPGGDLYVATQSGTVLVFQDLNKINGNVAPAAQFSIATMSDDLRLTVDANR